MFEAWSLSQRMRVRPSDLFFIDDELTAWCFDRAVVTFGVALENDLEKHMSKAKTDSARRRVHARVMSKWLDDPNDTGRFRDPGRR